MKEQLETIVALLDGIAADKKDRTTITIDNKGRIIFRAGFAAEGSTSYSRTEHLTIDEFVKEVEKLKK